MLDETKWVTVCDLHDPPGVRLRKFEDYFERELREQLLPAAREGLLESSIEPTATALRQWLDREVKKNRPQVEERAATAYAHIFGTH